MLAILDGFTGKPALLEKVELTSIDKLAKCNDGSPAVFYYRNSETNSDNWVIYLMGGGMCNSYESCEERAKANETKKLVTSSHCENYREFDGILNEYE